LKKEGGAYTCSIKDFEDARLDSRRGRPGWMLGIER
jgi:hypothetical protein